MPTETKQPEGPTVIPPPQPPELFPGFGKEYEQLNIAQYNAAQRAQEAKLAKAKAEQRLAISKDTGIIPALMRPGYEFIMGGAVGADVGTEESEMLRAQQEFTIAMQELNSIQWRMELMADAQVYLASPKYNIRSATDLLKYKAPIALTDADTAWLTSLYNRLKQYTNILPEDFTGDILEAQSKVLNEILTAPKLELKAVHNLTVDEIAKSFGFGVAQLPTGLTPDKVRDMLADIDITTAEMTNAEAYLAERARAWALATDRANLIITGTITAEAPDLTPIEFAALTLTQPMMATAELLDKYFNMLSRPLAAAAIIGTHRLFNTPEDTAAGRLDELYQYYRSMGEDGRSAYAMAFNDWDLSLKLRIFKWDIGDVGGLMKMAWEAAFDPVSYLGLGFGIAIGMKLGGVPTALRMVNKGTRIGNLLIDAESGFINGADAIFKATIMAPARFIGGEVLLAPAKLVGVALGHPWERGIPRSFTQTARNFANSGFMGYRATFIRAHPDMPNMVGGTAKDLNDHTASLIDQTLARPTEGWDLGVSEGSKLLEFNYLDDISGRTLLKGVADEIELDTTRLTHLNNSVLDMFSGQGERVTAGKVLADLGQTATEDSIEKLSTKLTALKQKIADDAKKALYVDDPDDILKKITTHLFETRYSNLQSPLSSYMKQAGRTGSWLSRVADNFLYSTALIALERRAVMPLAHLNLLVANLGPGNYLEGMYRGQLGGGELQYPNGYLIDHSVNALGDLPNFPFETIMQQRGEQRLAQALIDPMTGRSAVFTEGWSTKIPFVTKQVTVGGKTIAKNISIGGEDYLIGSAEDWHQMFGKFTNLQNTYDIHTQFYKTMATDNPIEDRAIRSTVGSHKSELAGVKFLSKRDMTDINRQTAELAFRSPEAVRAMGDVDVLTMERRLINKELGKDLRNATEVAAAVKNGISKETINGQMFKGGTKGIDARMDAWVQASRELEISSLKPQIDALKNEVDSIISAPAATLNDVLGDMQSLTAMVDASDAQMAYYRRLTALRGKRLTPGKNRDDFNTGSAKLLSDYAEAAETETERLIKHIDEIARTTEVLNDTQLSRLADLEVVERLRLTSIREVRLRNIDIDAKVARIPKNKRKDTKYMTRFWEQQDAEKALSWETHFAETKPLKSADLMARRNFLTSIDKPSFVPDQIPEVVGNLAPTHLAYLFGSTGDDLYRGLTRVDRYTTVFPKEDFVIYAREQANTYAAKFGKTADDLGFTEEGIAEVYDQLWRNLGIEPSTLTSDSPTMLQLENIRQSMHRLYAGNKIPESDVVKYKEYFNSVADDLERLPQYRQPVAGRAAVEQFPSGTSDWLAKKTSAMTKARELHALAFPTYDDANIIDEGMRAIFPFWNYELFRWRWLPRTFMRTPGTMTGLARYQEYTDQGYMPLGFADLQMNILRGSIWMGGLASLYKKDFPEFYDQLPGMEFIDYLQRLGFWLGALPMIPAYLFGTKEGKGELLAELAPPSLKTVLSALRALSPEHIGKVLDIIYPSRFRDFQTMLTLASGGEDADEIWRKRKTGEKLTPEEEKLWLKAENKVDGVKGVLMQQFGLFRIKPSEYTEIRKEMRLAIEEATGVPIAVQEQIDRRYPVTGKRFSDIYPLDTLQSKLLYEFETYRKWQGVITPLIPSGQQMMEVKIADYYATVEKEYDIARRVGLYEDDKLIRPSIVELNRQFVSGEIGPDQWRAARSGIVGGLAEAVRVLHDSPAYKDVPVTYEERAAYLAEKGIAISALRPDQELLYYYYELQPEYKWDWESQRMERDFDTYYANIDILLESLDASHRQRLLDRIQIDWTPMEKLYWQTSREHLRPYRNLRSIVLAEYDLEQIQQIRRYEVAQGTERKELQEVLGPDGEKLIAGFTKRLREARQRFRILDPETDAWLNFFGTTTSLLTAQSKLTYEELRKKYLVKEMIE